MNWVIRRHSILALHLRTSLGMPPANSNDLRGHKSLPTRPLYEKIDVVVTKPGLNNLKFITITF